MTNKKTCKVLPLLSLIIACSSLHGQTVFSDSTYNPADWSVRVVTAFGGSESHEQRLTGGNPGAFRYMEHVLPVPPGPADLTRVEVSHIYDADSYLPLERIDHIDYAEDIRLLNRSWEQAFIVSYPAIRQSGKFYRATKFLSVIADTMWQSGSITGLTANDFIALDGSNDRPDFSAQGDFLSFGFWRISTRGATLPPIPPNQDLIYQHGSDNFTVTVHNTPPANQPPIASGDEYLYLDYFFNSNLALPVLDNDSDPEGDPIRILSVDEPAFGGTIVSFNDNTITYSVEEPLRQQPESDFFIYTITDGQDESAPAFVNIYFCVCPIECIALFLAPPGNSMLKEVVDNVTTAVTAADTLDVDLFRQFRDDVLLPTETGSRFVDLYYRNAPEVMPLLLFERTDIGLQALTGLTTMQSPLRNLLDGDGSEIISQALVDTITVFLDGLMAAASDSLRDSLQVELARLGPLQDVVGLPVAEAVEIALGTPTHVDDARIQVPNDFVLQQNYPNPFNPATSIQYSVSSHQFVSLKVYDVLGKEVATLVDERKDAGKYTVSFDGTGLASGIYFAELQADKQIRWRKMLLVR